MRLRAVGAVALMAVGGLVLLLGMLGASEQPDPAGARIGVLVLSLPIVALGAWLWRRRNGGTPSGRRRAKMAAAGVVGVLMLALAGFAYADGEVAVAAGGVLFAVLALGYVAVIRNSASDDVVATMLDLPTGPEPGLLVVAPRTKRLVRAVGAAVAGLSLLAMAPAMRADGEGAWWLVGLCGVVVLVASPFMLLQVRGVAGLGISRSGVSFTAGGRTMLATWDLITGVEAWHMRAGRHGRVRMVGVHVIDVDRLQGLGRGLRRLARINHRLGPDLAWPATMFDLEDDRIVELVQYYLDDPERRPELDRVLHQSAGGDSLAARVVG